MAFLAASTLALFAISTIAEPIPKLPAPPLTTNYTTDVNSSNAHSTDSPTGKFKIDIEAKNGNKISTNFLNRDFSINKGDIFSNGSVHLAPIMHGRVDTNIGLVDDAKFSHGTHDDDTWTISQTNRLMLGGADQFVWCNDHGKGVLYKHGALKTIEGSVGVKHCESAHLHADFGHDVSGTGHVGTAHVASSTGHPGSSHASTSTTHVSSSHTPTSSTRVETSATPSSTPKHHHKHGHLWAGRLV